MTPTEAFLAIVMLGMVIFAVMEIVITIPPP